MTRESRGLGRGLGAVLGAVPTVSASRGHFDRIFGTNVKGVLFTVQKALPLMKDGGSIILMGSTTSLKGTENFSVYSASKAAVRNFARSWLLDLKARHTSLSVRNRSTGWGRPSSPMKRPT